MRRCIGWTRVSVGCRSDQISSRNAALLERQDLLRDEGLGQARIALDDDGDPPARASGAACMTALFGRLVASAARSGRSSRASAKRAPDDGRARRAGPGCTTSRTAAAGSAGWRKRRRHPLAGRALPVSSLTACARARAARPRRRGCAAPGGGGCAARSGRACRATGSRRRCCSRPSRRRRRPCPSACSILVSKAMASSFGWRAMRSMKPRRRSRLMNGPKTMTAGMSRLGLGLVGGNHPVDEVVAVAAAAGRDQNEGLLASASGSASATGVCGISRRR